MQNKYTVTNPIILQDYPDPDVIRVEDTYYMVSTTMHFMPGCVILRSYDLLHWEIASYVYEHLDDTLQQTLEDGDIYGQGMWAASIRYHNGTFYICFVANDTHKTYLYQSPSIDGPWVKSEITGFYHDSSLLFDEDERVYIVYGNKEIWLTELNTDLSGPKVGGLHRRILHDKDNPNLGYEGSHLYKINGRYYLFLIHSLPTEWRRVEACFVADDLNGEFLGGDVLNDDMGYCNQGVAQGGIVDTPDGDWFAVLFQDRGAIGRLPVLIPVRFSQNGISFGVNGKIPKQFHVTSTHSDYSYAPLYGSDDFNWNVDKNQKICPKNFWQWNHTPDSGLWRIDATKKALCITTGKLCSNLEQAVNTLTQRMLEPRCSAIVTVDASRMKNGDIAGLGVLQACYAWIGIRKEEQFYELLMVEKKSAEDSMTEQTKELKEEIVARIALPSAVVRLRVDAEFEQMKDECCFSYEENGRWKHFGTVHKMHFKLAHFTGNRFALFAYATKVIGGSALFSTFEFLDEETGCSN